MVDFSKAVAAAAAATNMNEASSGGSYQPPAEGVCRLRFVGYIELGKQPKTWKGVEKIVDKCKAIFEVSGPKHPPKEDGTPHLVELSLTKSNSEKAKFYKLFKRMNEDGKATHIAQLLGSAYLGDIRLNVVGEGDNTQTYVNLDAADGSWTIRSPRVQDPETGDFKVIKVADPVTPLRCFLWDFADMAQWSSIFIDGEYEAQEAKDGKPARPAKSKNRYQIAIQSAKNFDGSPMAELLKANGIEFEPGQQVQEDDNDHDGDDDGAAGDASADPLENAG